MTGVSSVEGVEGTEDSGADYDLRGAYKAGAETGPADSIGLILTRSPTIRP